MITYPAGLFLQLPKLSMTAQFNSGFLAQMARITIVENTKDNCTIYLEDGMGVPLANAGVQISYVAVEKNSI